MSEKLPKGLYRRGEIIWARFKVRGIEYRESLRTRSVAIAERRMKAVRQQIQDQVWYGAGEAVSWPRAVVAWDGWIKRQHKRPGTIRRYLVSLAQLRPWLDNRDIQAIDADLVRLIVRERARRGVSNATIRRDLSALASVLDAAIDEGWISDNPAHSFDRRRLTEKRDPIVLPDNESIAAVLALGTRFVDMAAFARLTGMREEEIASLRHDQVDRSRMAISLIHTKGRRAREVPLCPAALAVIDRQPQFLRSLWGVLARAGRTLQACRGAVLRHKQAGGTKGGTTGPRLPSVPLPRSAPPVRRGIPARRARLDLRPATDPRPLHRQDDRGLSAPPHPGRSTDRHARGGTKRGAKPTVRSRRRHPKWLICADFREWPGAGPTY